MDDNWKPAPESDLSKALKKIGSMNFNGFSMPNIVLDYKSIYDQMTKNIEPVEVDPIIPDGYFEKTQEYQEKSLEMLQSINTNTANLYTLVDLISNANDKQDELIELISEILTIAKAKSKEEADSFFKKAMNKINETVKTADSMVKIVGWATSIYNMVIAMLNK